MSRGEIRAFISEAETPRQAVAARSRRRAALSRRRPRTVGARTPPARRVGDALRLAARRGGSARSASTGPLSWTEFAAEFSRRHANDRRASGAMGRRGAGAPRRADQLSSVGGRRRRRARRQPCRARPRPVRGDVDPAAAAGTARLSRAGLFPPSVWSRARTGASCRRARTTPACSACVRAAPRRPTSAAWSAST